MQREGQTDLQGVGGAPSQVGGHEPWIRLSTSPHAVKDRHQKERWKGDIETTSKRLLKMMRP